MYKAAVCRHSSFLPFTPRLQHFPTRFSHFLLSFPFALSQTFQVRHHQVPLLVSLPLLKVTFGSTLSSLSLPRRTSEVKLRDTERTQSCYVPAERTLAIGPGGQASLQREPEPGRIAERISGEDKRRTPPQVRNAAVLVPSPEPMSRELRDMGTQREYKEVSPGFKNIHSAPRQASPILVLVAVSSRSHSTNHGASEVKRRETMTLPSVRPIWHSEAHAGEVKRNEAARTVRTARTANGSEPHARRTAQTTTPTARRLLTWRSFFSRRGDTEWSGETGGTAGGAEWTVERFEVLTCVVGTASGVDSGEIRGTASGVDSGEIRGTDLFSRDGEWSDSSRDGEWSGAEWTVERFEGQRVERSGQWRDPTDGEWSGVDSGEIRGTASGVEHSGETRGTASGVECNGETRGTASGAEWTVERLEGRRVEWSAMERPEGRRVEWSGVQWRDPTDGECRAASGVERIAETRVVDNEWSGWWRTQVLKPAPGPRQGLSLLVVFVVTPGGIRYPLFKSQVRSCVREAAGAERTQSLATHQQRELWQSVSRTPGAAAERTGLARWASRVEQSGFGVTWSDALGERQVDDVFQDSVVEPMD
ncbi:hypothetical protein DFJ77DRAFT_442588 [Powellomyces hirtus]|nr:hypothetical protein DFJ77DRAFT_442588 [Powellomyces hirtus]